MSALLKRPLTWIIAAEAVVVAVLGLTAWHLYQAHRPSTPQPLAPAALAPPQKGQRPPTPPVASPRPAAPTSSPTHAPTPKPGATPGLASNDPFLARQAQTLNRDQAAWEAAQWSLIKAGMDAMRNYIREVVTPAVDRAERTNNP